jgi:ABC-type multidrug transport system, ATPase component
VNKSNEGQWAIATQGLTKVYRGRITAVSDLTLRVRPGVVFGLLGPNGAGKSTLVKTLLSIVRPTAGTGALFGQDIRRPKARRGIGYLPEKPSFPPYLTGRGVCRYLGHLLGLGGAELERDIDQQLSRVGMTEAADRLTTKYSKGMLQRIGLAQAMLGQPRLIVLDEPTDGVDPDYAPFPNVKITAKKNGAVCYTMSGTGIPSFAGTISYLVQSATSGMLLGAYTVDSATEERTIACVAGHTVVIPGTCQATATSTSTDSGCSTGVCTE